ncbi:Neural cell adhesion molecule L1, partial [Varanus komodoensis]
MRKAGLDESPVRIKSAGRNINNPRYADETTVMAESEEELKSLLMRVKEESAKVGLKLNIKKTKIMASGPLTSWQIDGKEMEVVTDFIFLGSKITADGDCSQEIKRCLLLERKAMANLDSILKCRYITLPTKVRIVKAMVSLVAMYGCESWTIRKAEGQRTEAFELWCWRRLLRVPWTARRSNRSVLEEINPDCSLEGQIVKMKLKYFGHLMRRKDSLEKSLMLGTIDGKRRRGQQRMRFRWTKDGKKFDPHGMPGITQRKGSGTLIITTNGNVDTSFKGTYQCYASNILGSAMSSESEIIAESAPQWPKEKVAPITAEEGTSTVLPCNPPTSAVPPKIYWLNSKIEHITQDERVTMGQDGNLYFANVQMTDSRPDYICNAHFQGPRIIIQKEPIELKVIATNTLSHQKPILIVPNKKHSTYMALLGEPLVLECIVAGFPTPTVEWAHMNRLKLSPQVVFENSNKTLRILNVTEDDDGEYQCIAHNEHGTIRHTYTVTVE